MDLTPASCLGNACRHRALLPSARPLRPPARPQPSGASLPGLGHGSVQGRLRLGRRISSHGPFLLGGVHAKRSTSLMASWYHRWPSGSICRIIAHVTFSARCSWEA
jgi:hypothetical protein